MDRTDLSLLLSAFSVLIALHLVLVAALLIVAFVAGVLVGERRAPPP
jgi:hypothetical protein